MILLKRERDERDEKVFYIYKKTSTEGRNPQILCEYIPFSC